MGTILRSSSKKTQTRAPVILIQDLHDVPSAQKNIAALLQHLSRSGKNTMLVGVEGAAGPLNLSPFRRQRNGRFQETVSDVLLRSNLLSGPEYWGVNTSAEPTLWGVEKEADYRANVEAYRESRIYSAKLSTSLEQAETALGLQSARLLSMPASRWIRAVRSYDRGDIGVIPFVQAMAQSMSESSLPSEISKLKRVMDLESGLDFTAVEEERSALIDALTRGLTPLQIQSLTDLCLRHRSGDLSFGGFYGALENYARQSGLRLSRFPAFQQYVRYVLLTESIDKSLLFDSIEQAKEASVQRVGTTAQERELLRLHLDLQSVARLVRHEMTPPEWAVFSRRNDEINQLPDRLERFNVRLGPITDPLAPFKEFYVVAERRNHSLAEGVLAKSREMKADQTVLVAGGFHTRAIENILKERGIPFVTLTPTLSDLPKGSNYLSVFDGKPISLERLLAGDKLFLAAERLTAAHRMLADPGQRSPDQLNTAYAGLMAVLDPDSAAQNPSIRGVDETGGLRRVEMADGTIFVASVGAGPDGWNLILSQFPFARRIEAAGSIPIAIVSPNANAASVSGRDSAGGNRGLWLTLIKWGVPARVVAALASTEDLLYSGALAVFFLGWETLLLCAGVDGAGSVFDYLVRLVVVSALGQTFVSFHKRLYYIDAAGNLQAHRGEKATRLRRKLGVESVLWRFGFIINLDPVLSLLLAGSLHLLRNTAFAHEYIGMIGGDAGERSVSSIVVDRIDRALQRAGEEQKQIQSRMDENTGQIESLGVKILDLKKQMANVQAQRESAQSAFKSAEESLADRVKEIEASASRNRQRFELVIRKGSNNSETVRQAQERIADLNKQKERELTEARESLARLTVELDQFSSTEKIIGNDMSSLERELEKGTAEQQRLEAQMAVVEARIAIKTEGKAHWEAVGSSEEPIPSVVNQADNEAGPESPIKQVKDQLKEAEFQLFGSGWKWLRHDQSTEEERIQNAVQQARDVSEKLAGIRAQMKDLGLLQSGGLADRLILMERVADIIQHYSNVFIKPLYIRSLIQKGVYNPQTEMLEPVPFDTLLSIVEEASYLSIELLFPVYAGDSKSEYLRLSFPQLWWFYKALGQTEGMANTIDRFYSSLREDPDSIYVQDTPAGPGLSYIVRYLRVGKLFKRFLAREEDRTSAQVVDFTTLAYTEDEDPLYRAFDDGFAPDPRIDEDVIARRDREAADDWRDRAHAYTIFSEWEKGQMTKEDPAPGGNLLWKSNILLAAFLSPLLLGLAGLLAGFDLNVAHAVGFAVGLLAGTLVHEGGHYAAIRLTTGQLPRVIIGWSGISVLPAAEAGPLTLFHIWAGPLMGLALIPLTLLTGISGPCITAGLVSVAVLNLLSLWRGDGEALLRSRDLSAAEVIEKRVENGLLPLIKNQTAEYRMSPRDLTRLLLRGEADSPAVRSLLEADGPRSLLLNRLLELTRVWGQLKVATARRTLAGLMIAVAVLATPASQAADDVSTHSLINYLVAVHQMFRNPGAPSASRGVAERLLRLRLEGPISPLAEDMPSRSVSTLIVDNDQREALDDALTFAGQFLNRPSADAGLHLVIAADIARERAGDIAALENRAAASGRRLHVSLEGRDSGVVERQKDDGVLVLRLASVAALFNGLRISRFKVVTDPGVALVVDADGLDPAVTVDRLLRLFNGMRVAPISPATADEILKLAQLLAMA